MSKHTPGPWKVIVYPHIPDHPWIEAESNYNGSGTNMSVSGLVSVEDARLIAAAPDLLEALERLVANVDEGEFVSATRISEAYAAIKKAKGESQ